MNINPDIHIANPRYPRVGLFLFPALMAVLFAQAQEKRFSFSEQKMASPFHLILYAKDSLRAAQVSKAGFALVDSLVGILSDYIDSSELNRLCARAGHSGFVCSPVLYELLLRSKEAYEASDGKFDITLGPLTRLWREARKSGRFPDSATVEEKKSLSGFSKIRFDTVSHSVFLTQPGMRLDAGGIGQGFIAQKLADYLKTQQIRNALIDVSGDIVAIGRPPGKKGWTIAVNVPESPDELLPHELLIAGKAVTTSGDVYQFMVHDGKKFSHIVDPSTGYGITTQRNVTVIAADGTSADWITKAISLLPEESLERFAQKRKIEFLITEMKEGKIRYLSSRHFNTYWKKHQK